MAEAFLQIVLENLGSLIREEIGLIMGVDEELQKLASTLTTIQAVLEDAEDKQIGSKPIRDWLRKLNALTYEIDDILDECATHVSKLKHAGRLYRLQKILYQSKIARRVKQVTEKLDGVAAERAKFHLREMPLDRPREVAFSRETGSLLNEKDCFFGREKEIEEIVKALVNDVREKQEVSVLPIIGMGGLGKTTLAQKVFNDPRVEEHFEKRIWVCVSDNFDIKTLVKAMIESGTGSGKASDLQHLDALERSLWELLSQRRYLVVLDDVWNDQQEKWFELRNILSCGSAGASILVTTRQRKVADIMRTLPALCLEGLSDEHCWMLLRSRAFGQDEDVDPKLEVIGTKIVEKCAGVPLAAKALGGILRFKRKEKEWMNVIESNVWKNLSEEALILPVLRLSYHHLPLQLRQCFAYFAVFPKDHCIERNELIRMWMAHGYISSRGILEVEDVGNEICDELVLRSLLQTTRNGRISMHDLVHDLAQSIMENKVPGIPNESNIACSSTIRQVSLSKRTVSFPNIIHEDMDICTILEYTSLRVLDASHTAIKELPASIVNLKHLRLLNLLGTEIRTLPNSLCTLRNLQILNLDFCRKLVALPKNMRYLHNLQHLCLENCDSLSEMPPRMSELSLLKTLSKFIVGRKRGNQLEELQCLNLSGSLEIEHLERVKDDLDAKSANLSEKKNLRKLSFSWERNNLSDLREDVDEKVLEALQPHPNLESLRIRGYSGRCFPIWMTNSTLKNIVSITIQNCRNCRRLPELGELPLLATLKLKNLMVEYIIDDEVQNENSMKIKFPSLEHLILRNLSNLKEISKEQKSKEVLPNLKRLDIYQCSSLIFPPLSSLQKLESLECSSSTLASLPELENLLELTVRVEEKLVCFPVEMVAKFSKLSTLKIHDAKEISMAGAGIRSLKNLHIMFIETMTCLPKEVMLNLTALTHLHIFYCPEFVELPEEIKYLNLESISLASLPKMTCLPEVLQHLSSLKFLKLWGLPQLSSLSDRLHQLTSLQHIFLSYCPKVPSLEVPPNLKSLYVSGCPKLERRCRRGSGEDWHKIAHIPHLRIG